jgi:hypothetical protein
MSDSVEQRVISPRLRDPSGRDPGAAGIGRHGIPQTQMSFIDVTFSTQRDSNNQFEPQRTRKFLQR